MIEWTKEKAREAVRRYSVPEELGPYANHAVLHLAEALRWALDRLEAVECRHDFQPVCRTWEKCTKCGERQ